MTKAALYEQIQLKKSFLCVGLDTDITKIPKHLLAELDPMFAFNKAIIDATQAYTVAYKPNTAFYETLGSKGWETLEKTVAYIRSNYPDIFIIADAKRGDIGNTSAMYAKAFFEGMDVHSVTVAPYMGSDSVKPFLGYPNKWVILLALTSNQGAFDFQFETNTQGQTLFEKVLTTSKEWGSSENMMYVVGATKAESLADIRKIVPDHFLLVPGVGAQGGSLAEVAKYGLNAQCGLLVNSSRAIIYASGGTDFAERAAKEAEIVQAEMATYLG
ncbi:MAG: hypothetical protein RIS47_2016 [Bacteroidota bacterium]|jgi:orotidine-5'-phosphate decarboxylase